MAKADDKIIQFIIITTIKLFCFYSVLCAYNINTYFIDEIHSLGTFLKTVFFSRMTLTSLALICGTYMCCFISIFISAFICHYIEKVRKQESEYLYGYITVLLATFVFTINIIKQNDLFISYAYLILLPYEKIPIIKYIKQYAGTLIISSIAILSVCFVVLMFKYLETLNTPYKHSATTEKNIKAIEEVYICTGNYSKTYHKNRSCKGLSKCKASVKRIDLKQAKKKGRRACKICY